MDDLAEAIRKLKELERGDFIKLGRVMEEGDKELPWKKQGLTKIQWLVGMGVIPAVARQAQVAAQLLTIGQESDFNGITLNNLKMILPYLKEAELDRVKRVKILLMGGSMLFNDLKDELREGKVAKHNCDDYKWIKEEKVSWRCGFEGCNKRVYTDPNKKE